MNKEEATKYIAEFEGDNIEIIDTANAEDNDYLTKQIATATGKAYGDIDNVLKEFEYDKQGKTSESVKFYFTSLNQKLTKLADVEKDNTTLLEQIETIKKDGITDEKVLENLEKYKKDVDGLTAKLAENKTTFETELNEKSKELNSFKINSLLRNSLPNLKHEDKSYLDFKIQTVLQEIKSDFEVNIVNDKIELKKDYETFDINKVLEEKLKDLTSVDKKDFGGKPSITPVNATTKDELLVVIINQLETEGLKPSDRKYHERQRELLKEYDYESKK